MYYLTPFFEKPWSWDMRLRCGGRFHRRIEGFNPDLVVSLHPMTQALPLTVLETMGRQAGHGSRQIPFATVCTDLGGAHPGWFDKRANQTFVASESLERIVRSLAAELSKSQPGKVQVVATALGASSG